MTKWPFPTRRTGKIRQALDGLAELGPYFEVRQAAEKLGIAPSTMRWRLAIFKKAGLIESERAKGVSDCRHSWRLTALAHDVLAETSGAAERLNQHHAAVLKIIADAPEPLGYVQLTKLLKLKHRSTLCHMMRRFEAAGFVRLRPTGKSSRRWDFVVTEAGLEALKTRAERKVESKAATMAEVEREALLAYASRRNGKVTWAALSTPVILRRLGLRSVAEIAESY